LPFRVELARSAADVERLAAAWDRVEWEREEAERDYFLTRLDARPGVTGLFGILVLDGEEPVAALAARREDRRLPTAFGYRVVYAPRVRLLQIVDGGVVVQQPAALEPRLRALRAELARGETDAVAVPVLPVDSPLFAALEGLGGPLEQQRFLTTYTRRRLVLPESFEAFLASRTQKVRRGIRYDSKKLLDALGDELAVEILREPESFERLVSEVDGIAVSTYQRALGAGFADTPEQRSIIRIGLEKGYVRAYLLYHRGTPIAYWVGSVYRGTMFLRATGFDHAYARNRVGVYLLMRVIDDLCADPAVGVLDFGPGDAEYKRLFTNDGVVERNLVVFAPTFRARRINAARTVILGSARLGRRVANATKLTDRVKARWKSRLRTTG
jgi:Acetyltransferase (GNAT) domain